MNDEADWQRAVAGMRAQTWLNGGVLKLKVTPKSQIAMFHARNTQAENDRNRVAHGN